MGRQRIVIFGGPDRCGKTTIARELAKVLGVPYFKPMNQRELSLECPEVFEHQTRWGEPKLLDFLRQTGHSAVMDRGFPCDWAYSRALERETAWEAIVELDEGYAELGATIVFTLRKSYAGWADDANPRIDQEKLEELDRLYREYAENTSCGVLLLETDDQNLTGQIYTITHAMGLL